MQRFLITGTLNGGEYRPFLHAIRGVASRRTAFHRIYARALPLPYWGRRGALRVGWDEGRIWSVLLESVYLGS
ncbi:protein of unknown function [Methanoculleus bourgensis]|uniref:Uncharacterized protein n=1 Tax=Methanoculleus bourgensis TaxID=83986 RepID=A0A0X3BP98_9EURY|nr:protein of unknown function [Methanoculleus bourgensis]